MATFATGSNRGLCVYSGCAGPMAHDGGTIAGRDFDDKAGGSGGCLAFFAVGMMSGGKGCCGDNCGGGCSPSSPALSSALCSRARSTSCWKAASIFTAILPCAFTAGLSLARFAALLGAPLGDLSGLRRFGEQ